MIEELLIELKMFGALNNFKSMTEDTLTKEQMLQFLLKSEIDWKSEKRLKRRLKTATFPYEKEWGQIKQNKNPKVPFKKIMKYSDGKFVNDKKNLCFIGTPGLGKTHGLIAIGRDLCRKGYKVKFYTAIDLVNKLQEAKDDHNLSKLMDKIVKPHLLIVDELGFIPFTDEGARLLFDVFSKRYEQGSIAISTNLSLPKWSEIFGSIELTTALLDRFTHKCDIINFEGESYRLQESKRSKSLQ